MSPNVMMRNEVDNRFHESLSVCAPTRCLFVRLRRTLRCLGTFLRIHEHKAGRGLDTISPQIHIRPLPRVVIQAQYGKRPTSTQFVPYSRLRVHRGVKFWKQAPYRRLLVYP